MTLKTDYRLNRHHKFEQDGRKYVADLETYDIIQVSDVEWDILNRYGSETEYEIVEGLKEKYKIASVFDGITRLEWLGKRGQLLTRVPEARGGLESLSSVDDELKLLVPFGFTKEQASLDYITSLNRYQLLASLARSAELETFGFSEVGEGSLSLTDMRNYEKIHIREIKAETGNTLTPAWYAQSGYDGILLLSQFMPDDLLYYQVRDIPIVQCIENSQKPVSSLLESFMSHHAVQKPNDHFVVKASWMKQWLSESGIPGRHIHVIPDGINVVEPIDKRLAKQHTAAIFDNAMFAQGPVVGLISGFEPTDGAKWIFAFARAHPHLSIFVYDHLLAQHYGNLPANVVIFRADDAEMSAILPIFLQALDVVCFPAMPGTPLSVVLEAMAYGIPCISMTKYDLPPEVSGAGVRVELEWNTFGDFHVSMDELSAAIHQGLAPSKMRFECERVARNFVQKYTWHETASRILQVFEKCHLSKVEAPQSSENLFRPIFCRRYSPRTRETTSDAYRLGINRYEDLEKALAETLMEQHKPTEVESIFKHFKMGGSDQRGGNFVPGMEPEL